ncbi:MAG: META domain-containing protein [Chitinophagaceae bacterium]|nr:META domain-containing protein [Chitinophagaceae bacterium]MBK9570436.1 META domain-containing protein [Chitinophagaceae bacterium]MBL0131213.1 META domain-containing protein [Chitinophagaceae bacterium]MBL0273164.1 META domain-containing protein [Chitinophagaceae bacterium]
MKYILFLSFISLQCSPRLSPDSNWGNQRWVLTEMKGVPVQQSESRRDAYLSFEVNEKRFVGNGGCNQISGNYTIDKNLIRFGEVVSTKMSCNDNEFENAFISTLNSIDHYEASGNELFLKRKREVLLVLRIK